MWQPCELLYTSYLQYLLVTAATTTNVATITTAAAAAAGSPGGAYLEVALVRVEDVCA